MAKPKKSRVATIEFDGRTLTLDEVQALVRDFNAAPAESIKTNEKQQREQFLGLSPEQQVAALRGIKVEREFIVEREAIDKEKRTVWMSIASEEPYARWWGIEILDLASGSVRNKRLKSGAPLLVGHDHTDQVGVVEDYEITPDRKLRVLARFSRSARAEDIWQYVLDGIRRNTSVGYMIHELVLEKQDEGTNTYRVTDWEPYEGSLVAVPADPSVGVGRAHGGEPAAPPSQPETRTTMNEEEKKAAAEKAEREAAEIRKKEQERVSAILAAGDEFKDFDGPTVAREVIKDPNATVETLRSRLADKLRSHKPKGSATAEPGSTHPAFGTAGREMILRGRQLRSFTQPMMFTDGSKMEPEEAAYRSSQWMLAALGNNERARKWCRDHGIDIEQRVMTEGTGTTGGYISMPTEMEQAVIDLREMYGLARRLARRRPMGSDTKSIPKRAGGITAYFVEEDNSGVAAADKSWGNVNLAAKTLAALTLISKKLEEDSAIDAVDDLVQEQAYAFALKEDQCWLIGDGTSTYGGMTGLITLMEATAYASRSTTVSGHDTFAEIDATDLTNCMGSVADFAGLNPSWISSKLFDAMVFNRLKASAGGNTIQTLEGRPRPNFLGYDVNTSEIMPRGAATDYTSLVMALFGDFSQSSSFGDRRGIMVEVLRERYAEKLQLGVLSHERFHIVNHDLGSTTAKGPVAALYGNS